MTIDVFSGANLNKVFHKKKYKINSYYLVYAEKGKIVEITNDLIEKIFGDAL